MCAVAEKGELALAVRLTKKSQELAAEEAAQHTHWKKEAVPARHPPGTVERDAAARHDAVDVRVMMQVLPPSVEHREEADLGAEMLPIGGNLQQGLGSRTEQQVIDDFLILQCQRRQFLGQREHEVKIRHGKKFLGSLGKPLLPRTELALRAMSIPARVVSDYAMAALVTLFEVTAESRGAAGADVAESFALLWGDGMSPLRQKLLLVLADDIGYFEPMFGHLRRPSQSAT